jgi:hypothetical protein
MPLKVYNPPESIKQPEYGGDFDAYMAAEAAYIEELRAFCKKRKPRGQLVGEIVQFPVADGYAQYMVASIRPCELVHIPTGDAWEYAHIERLTAADIRANVESSRHLKSLFAEKQKNGSQS